MKPESPDTHLIALIDRVALADEAANLGITLQEDGSLAYTNGLTLADFQTGRVGGDLTLNEETEVL